MVASGVLGYPKPSSIKASRFVNLSTGDLSLTNNSSVWGNVSTALDMTLPAEIGDVIEVGLNGVSSSSASDIGLDVVSVVAGSPVNSWLNQGPALSGPPLYSVASWHMFINTTCLLAGSVMKTIVSSDISGGSVLLRFRYQMWNGTATKTLAAGTNYVLQVFAKNLGPQS